MATAARLHASGVMNNEWPNGRGAWMEAVNGVGQHC